MAQNFGKLQLDTQPQNFGQLNPGVIGNDIRNKPKSLLGEQKLSTSEQSLATMLQKRGGGALAGIQEAQTGVYVPKDVPKMLVDKMTPEQQTKFKEFGGTVSQGTGIVSRSESATRGLFEPTFGEAAPDIFKLGQEAKQAFDKGDNKTALLKALNTVPRGLLGAMEGAWGFIGGLIAPELEKVGETVSETYTGKIADIAKKEGYSDEEAMAMAERTKDYQIQKYISSPIQKSLNIANSLADEFGKDVGATPEQIEAFKSNFGDSTKLIGNAILAKEGKKELNKIGKGFSRLEGGFGDVVQKTAPAVGKGISLVEKGAGALAKTGKELTKQGASAVSKGVSSTVGAVEKGLANRAIAQTQKKLAKETKQVAKKKLELKGQIDKLIKSKKAFLNAERKPQYKNANVREQLSDPDVFAGLQPEGGKLNPDESILTLQERINSAMKSKREMLPIADERGVKVTKEEIRKEAIKNIPELPPKEELKRIKEVEDQVDALPDEMNMSQLDNLRARFRNSAKDAKGIQKSDTAFASLENATRDLVFDKVDEFSGGKGSFGNLNKYIRDTISTIDFLDKSLRGHIIKSGGMTKLFSRGIGTVAGSSGGVLGSLGGAYVGGVVSDIISNNVLGNTVKRKMLINLSNGTPEQIKIIDDLLKNIPDMRELEAPTTEFRTQQKGLESINLPRETASTIEGRENQRFNLSKTSNKTKPTSAVSNKAPISKELSKPTIQKKQQKSSKTSVKPKEVQNSFNDNITAYTKKKNELSDFTKELQKKYSSKKDSIRSQMTKSELDKFDKINKEMDSLGLKIEKEYKKPKEVQTVAKKKAETKKLTDEEIFAKAKTEGISYNKGDDIFDFVKKHKNVEKLYQSMIKNRENDLKYRISEIFPRIEVKEVDDYYKLLNDFRTKKIDSEKALKEILNIYKKNKELKGFKFLKKADDSDISSIRKQKIKELEIESMLNKQVIGMNSNKLNLIGNELYKKYSVAPKEEYNILYNNIDKLKDNKDLVIKVKSGKELQTVAKEKTKANTNYVNEYKKYTDIEEELKQTKKELGDLGRRGNLITSEKGTKLHLEKVNKLEAKKSLLEEKLSDTGKQRHKFEGLYEDFTTKELSNPAFGISFKSSLKGNEEYYVIKELQNSYVAIGKDTGKFEFIPNSQNASFFKGGWELKRNHDFDGKTVGDVLEKIKGKSLKEVQTPTKKKVESKPLTTQKKKITIDRTKKLSTKKEPMNYIEEAKKLQRSGKLRPLDNGIIRDELKKAESGFTNELDYYVKSAKEKIKAQDAENLKITQRDKKEFERRAKLEISKKSPTDIKKEIESLKKENNKLNAVEFKSSDRTMRKASNDVKREANNTRINFLKEVLEANKKTTVKVPKQMIEDIKKAGSKEEFIKSQGISTLHGTGTKFDSFDDSMRGSLTGAKSAEGAVWFTDDATTAKAYSIYSAEEGVVKKALAESDELEKIAKRSGKQSDWDKYDKKLAEAEDLADYNKTFERRKEANVKEVVIKGDLYEIDAKGKSPQELSKEGDIDSWLNEQIEKAKKLGKDGLKINNLDDAVGLYDRPATHYAIFDSKNIKTKSQLSKIYDSVKKTEGGKKKVIPKTDLSSEQEGAISAVAKFRHDAHVTQLNYVKEYENHIEQIERYLKDEFDVDLKLKGTNDIYTSEMYDSELDGDFDEYIKENEDLFSEIKHSNNEKIEKWLDLYGEAPSGYARMNYR